MKKMLIVLVLVFPRIGTGQTIFQIRSGIASYALDDFKSYQQAQLSSFLVPAKEVSSFPSYYYYGLGVDHVGRNFVTGMQLNFGSTGGRVYYSDYSGVIGSDKQLSYTDLSGTVGYLFGSPNSKFRFGWSANLGVLLGKATITNYLDISGYPSNYNWSSSYNNFNFFIQPNFNLRYRLGPLILGTSVGYNFNAIKSELYGGGGAAPSKADFSGIRANLSLGIAITKDNTEVDQSRPNISLAYGLGLDYGGIGANILVRPFKNFGVFTGVGYALAGAGVNGGFKFFFNSKNKSSKVFATAMYGYNLAVVVYNNSSFNHFFYGPSFGVGMDRANKKGKPYSIQLIIPIRGQEGYDYINYLKSTGVSFSNFVSPVLISYGRRINF